MKKKWLIPLLIFLLIGTMSSQSHTNTTIRRVFSCKGERIRQGETTYGIYKKCGAPIYREKTSAKGCKKVEIWYYDCTNRRRIEMLKFTGGILQEYSSGEKTQGVQICK